MVGDTRGVMQEGTRWTVRETDTSHVPGAHGARCLIFESDGILRRAWLYPTNWALLSDQQLIAVMESRAAAIGSAPDRGTSGDESLLTGYSNAVITHARMLVAAAALVRSGNQALRAEQQDLRERNRRARDEMRTAIERYATSLRQAGVTREHAVALVVGAARGGLADSNAPLYAT
ncbi:MAG: hypothetical protein ACREMU_04815, partial [Gemmatimonadaceae bacterium]